MAKKPRKAKDATAAAGAVGIRIRMYRVGFGDFFLMTVPGLDGLPRHILVDCGVHAANLGSMPQAVKQLAEDTERQLALVIMTHRHADHISGFASEADQFRGFTVERVWMPWFENPADRDAVRFQANLTAVAQKLVIGLAARGDDPETMQLRDMAGNALGESAVNGLSGNDLALQVLHGGFAKPAPVDYYKAGDPPVLPQSLAHVGLTAQILGPPIDPDLIKEMDDKNHQYLAAADALDGRGRRSPFASAYLTTPDSYHPDAFAIFDPETLVRRVGEMQPDLLAAKARQADNTLNNQSLVVLFGFRGKSLLFAGDAQWGNWQNFLYGGAFGAAGHTELTPASRKILENLNFYKVGHHGSTNANPMDAMEILRLGCAAMCSTADGAYGKPEKGTEVPRSTLMQRLFDKTGGMLARSDQVAVDPPEGGKRDDYGAQHLPLPPGFKAPAAKLYIDYEL